MRPSLALLLSSPFQAKSFISLCFYFVCAGVAFARSDRSPFLDKAIQSAFARKAMRKGANAALFWEKG